MANTPNLGLHQWAAGDSFLRTDFNSDFSKIDGAVGEKCRMAWGTYVGNSPNAINSANGQFIPLPFTPGVVMVHRQSTTDNLGTPSMAHFSGMAIQGVPLETGGYTILKAVENGLEVGSARIGASDQHPKLNDRNAVYLYLAFQ